MLIAPDGINKSLSNKGWSYADQIISKSFNFDTYMEGINFVNKTAELAEANNHHPNITIGWCHVHVSISSHDLGGVTTKCINLATGIDLI